MWLIQLPIKVMNSQLNLEFFSANTNHINNTTGGWFPESGFPITFDNIFLNVISTSQSSKCVRSAKTSKIDIQLLHSQVPMHMTIA